MKKEPKARKRGFTLTEILVVVLIIAVLSAVVYPLYTKSITKSRAVEAINLLEMVRNKQIQQYARENTYFDEFNSMGQLTSNLNNEQIISGGSQLHVKDYTLSLNNATKCMSAKYQKGSSAFTFSTSYENAGLGCTGSICTSFGDIIGDAKTVCNCGSKTCDNGYTLNEDTCNCDCLMSCDQGGKCYDMYGGGLTRPCSSGCGTESSTASCGGSVWSGKCWSITQEQPTSQGCGWNNSGTQTRTCTATCNKGSCGSWGPCRNQQCNPATKPAGTQNCGKNNTGTQTRPVTCNPDTGGWETGGWSACTGQVCDPKEKPATTQNCGKNNSGTQTRPQPTCDSNTGNWSDPGAWGPCTGQVCPPSEKPASSQNCGKNNTGTQTRPEATCDSNTGNWSAPGAWGACKNQQCDASEKPAESQNCGKNNSGTQTRPVTCNSDTGSWQPGDWSSCTGQSCVDSEKPSLSQSCGNCGSQTRTVTCNSNTGAWNAPSAWGTCGGQGACAPGTTQSCGNNNTGSQSCSSSCSWNSCTGERFECSGSSSQGCGKCGTQSRTCNTATGTWGAWGACTGEGSCSPGATQSCGNNSTGSQTCSSSCSWNSCTGERFECSGSSSQGCGKCGTQSRTCNTSTGSWGAWGACTGEGSCSPGAVESCGGGNGNRVCASSCAWGSCSCNSGYKWNGSTCVKVEIECSGSATQGCGNCGTQSRTCDKSTGTWGAWGTCSGQGACSPGATERSSCPSGYDGSNTRTCNSSCSWGGWSSNCTQKTCSNKCPNGMTQASYPNCSCSCPYGTVEYNGYCSNTCYCSVAHGYTPEMYPPACPYSQCYREGCYGPNPDINMCTGGIVLGVMP